jgi:hypothetical protein
MKYLKMFKEILDEVENHYNKKIKIYNWIIKDDI